MHPTHLLSGPQLFIFFFNSHEQLKHSCPQTLACAAGRLTPLSDLPSANSGGKSTARSAAGQSQQFRPSNRPESGSPLIPKNTLGRPLSQNATKPRKSRSRFGFQGRHGDRELFWLQKSRHLGSPHCRPLSKWRPPCCAFLIGCANYKMPPSGGLNGNLPWSGVFW